MLGSSLSPFLCPAWVFRVLGPGWACLREDNLVVMVRNKKGSASSRNISNGCNFRAINNHDHSSGNNVRHIYWDTQERLWKKVFPKPNLVNKPPPLNGDDSRDPNIKALKRKGFMNQRRYQPRRIWRSWASLFVLAIC